MSLMTLVVLILTTILSVSGTASADGFGSREFGHYKKLNDHTYLVVLQPGAKLMKSLQAFQAAVKFPSGSLNGVGVTRNTTLGFYKFGEDGLPGRTHTDDTVKDPREIVSLTCNFASVIVEAGKSNILAPPHCHISLAGIENPVADQGRGWPVVGGHLIEAEVAVTAELIVTTYPSVIVKRPSPVFGGFLVDINQAQGGKAFGIQ